MRLNDLQPWLNIIALPPVTDGRKEEPLSDLVNIGDKIFSLGDLLKDTNYIEERAFQSINDDAEEIGKMLWAILKTCQENTKNQKPKTDNW